MIHSIENLIKDPEIQSILNFYKNTSINELMTKADSICRLHYGEKVFLRGLIEFSNFCIMDCQYCGIRRSNSNVQRYRMTPNQIVALTKQGYEAGLQTFVLQSGEDPWFTQEIIADLIKAVKQATDNNAAITLSMGIRNAETYRTWKKAGADRYLMRFETSDPDLHAKLRPKTSLKRRIQALEDLRDCGFEVGSGYMVGLPEETEEIRINNALLCRALGLQMVGIGPFIPHPETPLAHAAQQPIELALKATALVRMLLPQANIPATTAAGSLDKKGREKMLSAGANVLMPNITPEEVKKNYLLYPNKICLDESGFECMNCLDIRTRLVKKIICYERGNSLIPVIQ